MNNQLFHQQSLKYLVGMKWSEVKLRIWVTVFIWNLPTICCATSWAISCWLYTTTEVSHILSHNHHTNQTKSFNLVAFDALKWTNVNKPSQTSWENKSTCFEFILVFVWQIFMMKWWRQGWRLKGRTIICR